MNSSGDEVILKVNLLDTYAEDKIEEEDRNTNESGPSLLSPPKTKTTDELYTALLNAIKNINQEMEERILKEVSTLKRAIWESINTNNLEEIDVTKRDPSKSEQQSEAVGCNLRVKVCRVPNCSYVERKTANNMKYHYVLYHEDLEYPNKPFDEVKMCLTEYEWLKKHWLESDQRLSTLARRREKEAKTSKKRKWKEA